MKFKKFQTTKIGELFDVETVEQSLEELDDHLNSSQKAVLRFVVDNPDEKYIELQNTFDIPDFIIIGTILEYGTPSHKYEEVEELKRRLETREYMNRQLLTQILEKDKIPTTKDGLEKTSSGNNRIVFRIVDDRFGADSEGMMVKRAFPYVDENRKECQIWNTVSGTHLEDCFVPVHEHADDLLWVVMPEAETDSKTPTTVVQQFRDRFGANDVSPSDFGRMNDQWKCFDYASCSFETLHRLVDG